MTLHSYSTRVASLNLHSYYHSLSLKSRKSLLTSLTGYHQQQRYFSAGSNSQHDNSDATGFIDDNAKMKKKQKKVRKERKSVENSEHESLDSVNLDTETATAKKLSEENDDDDKDDDIDTYDDDNEAEEIVKELYEQAIDQNKRDKQFKRRMYLFQFMAVSGLFTLLLMLLKVTGNDFYLKQWLTIHRLKKYILKRVQANDRVIQVPFFCIAFL